MKFPILLIVGLLLPLFLNATTTFNSAAVAAASDLHGLKVIFVRHTDSSTEEAGPNGRMRALGFPTNHESQSAMRSHGYQCEIVVLDLTTGQTRTIHRPGEGFFLGHIDLHWSGEKFLFTEADENHLAIYEMNVDGSNLRQVSQLPADVDAYEPLYAPNGKILFTSNAPFQCVPCWHGQDHKFVANLYSMNEDGSGVRRLTFDQVHDTNPIMMRDGRVIYSRWDYAGINRVFYRPVLTMNPDGTAQKPVYGSNSWFPNVILGFSELPDSPGKFATILSGYHGSSQSGQLVILDLNKGFYEDEGITQRISGEGKGIEVKYMDGMTMDEPQQLLQPATVTDNTFLVSGWDTRRDRRIGIYLAQTDDTLELIYAEDGKALIEVTPIQSRPKPHVLPERVDLEKDYATVYIHDVYLGPGLAGVPRGTIKDLRIIGYDWSYVSLAGTDKIGISGPWEVMRIIGTTPVEADGSASFKVPANTPIAFQALDAEGKAVQLMRTWHTAMPGEALSCVGCHESPNEAPSSYGSAAARRLPYDLREWYGPARGFDFAREVQPVLNRHCLDCHDGSGAEPDLRPEEMVPEYAGRIPGHYDRKRLWKEHQVMNEGRIRYTPAYEELIEYIRRVNIGDDVSILRPGHYHADTSELVQMLQNGHHGVKLDKEGWDRIVTWIDLNGPAHGAWYDVFNAEAPSGHMKRRLELNKDYANIDIDYNVVPETPPYNPAPVNHETVSAPAQRESLRLVGARSTWNQESFEVDLGDGQSIKFVRIPAEEPFWMSVTEISNAQFRAFNAAYDSGFYTKRHPEERADGKGLSLNDPEQPVLRVSWNQAQAFCDWLSEKTGRPVALPSAQQWELACSAGSPASFHYGSVDDDFSTFANMADNTFINGGYRVDGVIRIASDVDFLSPEGVALADARYDDGGLVTMPVGSYQPNPLGLYDMHGNAAEWTSTGFAGEMIVKGGSYLDRPERCAADLDYRYPAWQRVYNVGFRIVIPDAKLQPALASKALP